MRCPAVILNVIKCKPSQQELALMMMSIVSISRPIVTNNTIMLPAHPILLKLNVRNTVSKAAIGRLVLARQIQYIILHSMLIISFMNTWDRIPIVQILTKYTDTVLNFVTKK